jgi:hypothetical protein
LNQEAQVIVNDLREQARSHIWSVPAFDFAVASIKLIADGSLHLPLIHIPGLLDDAAIGR